MSLSPRPLSGKDAPLREPPQSRGTDEREFNRQDFQRRMTVNLAGVIFFMLLLMAGFWIVWHMADAKRAQDCLSAGHRNCSVKQKF
jgi:hypothetical protein